ncbi:hypothetical protein BDY21DRAFT_381977 [Lineolata rhizophorae]|uniref:DUF8021 domain-containing protein n=1 Tax=Lineolata rhizophorae TaxID=578093 RepID=A0A6A6NQ63_9PEZI|nr:hypothetical protein BDY21DRAFT_381977 [Lineolata rhizophorae]
MLYSILLAGASLAATVSAECSRSTLQDATDAYVAAQSGGSSSAMTAVAPDVTYTENEQPMDMSSGVLTQALTIDRNVSIHDTVQCATFTELIAASAEHPYVIGTRMLFDADGTQINTIESIVTDQGDWAFNATGYLYWSSMEDWSPIPEAERDNRDVIQAAGDAYFDRFNNVNVTVPWGTPCARLEGGAYTGARNVSANTCNLGLPETIEVTNRRYVIDEVMGAVDMFLGFPGLDRSQGQEPMPDSHFFRVEDGKIKYIHTVSSCVEAGCGLSGMAPPSF